VSIFASRTQKTIPIPFDPPHEVTIQKLAGRHLGKAQLENQVESVDNLRRMGGAAFQKELEALGDRAKREELIKKHQADPLNTYDRYEVLAKGIKSWTYEESLTPVEIIDEQGVKRLRIPAIEDLEDEPADFLAREILRLTKPSLFQTPEEAKADQKETAADSSVAGR
jgi:hypothetical protein